MYILFSFRQKSKKKNNCKERPITAPKMWFRKGGWGLFTTWLEDCPQHFHAIKPRLSFFFFFTPSFGLIFLRYFLVPYKFDFKEKSLKFSPNWNFLIFLAKNKKRRLKKTEINSNYRYQYLWNANWLIIKIIIIIIIIIITVQENETNLIRKPFLSWINIVKSIP